MPVVLHLKRFSEHDAHLKYLNPLIKVKVSPVRLGSTLKQTILQIRTTDPETAAVCT